MQRRVWRARAFTLVELLVVMGIIAVLAGLLLPALRMALVRARRISCMNNLREIGMGFQAYLQDYGEAFPAAADPVSTSPYYWLWMGRGWRPALGPYLADEKKVFWCPMDTTAVTQYASTSYAYAMCFYHSPDQINSMTSAAACYSNPLPPVAQHLARVKMPEKKALAGEWFSNHVRVVKDNGWWNWEGGRTFIFVDGHAEFRDARSLRPANDGWPDINLTHDGIRGADVD
jgi:prepilin-type N-terminal cleavage/methylation domain-containing protein